MTFDKSYRPQLTGVQLPPKGPLKGERASVVATPEVAAAFKTGLLDAIPSLRAFALSLVYQPDRADDLVQETLVKAWANQHMFQPQTNIKAWLFTILRNQFYTEFRKRRMEVPDSDGFFASQLSTQPTQSVRIEFELCRKALKLLPEDQREALLLVGVSGFSYEEAANICGVALGTIKSRINRGRIRLAELMNMTSSNDFDDDVMRAAAGAMQVGVQVPTAS